MTVKEKPKFLEANKDMTMVEQLEIYLTNKLTTDKLHEPNKTIDPEYYDWYVANKKQSFEEFYNITIEKSIFFKVETNKGNRYFVTNGKDWTDIWAFKEVSEEHFNCID